MTLPQALSNPKLIKIRPTQMTVGFSEVEEKQREWRDVPAADRETYLIHHAFPAVRGPGDRYFITDHHHLGRALVEDGVERCYAAQLDDLSALETEEFWVVMDHRQWVHPYDADGKRRSFDDIPKKLIKLADDPFRSLAAEVRRKGGYAKETEPFAEFLWADFLRRRISAHELADDPKKALATALKLSHSPKSQHLPGWSGVLPP